MQIGRKNQSNSRVFKSVLVLFILGLMMIAVKDDTNPLGMRLHELVDAYSNTPGTLNGWFASIVDPKICIKLKQKGNVFFSAKVSDMALFDSIKGTFDTGSDSSGALEMENGAGLTRRGQFRVGHVDGRDQLDWYEDANGTHGIYVRTSRSQCHIKSHANSCIAKAAVEEEDNLSSSKMDIVIGRWYSRHGDFVAKKLDNGKPLEYEIAATSDLQWLIKKGVLVFTKTLSNGDLTGIISVGLFGGFTRDVRFELGKDGDEVRLFNCDGSPKKFKLTKSVREQDL